MVMTQDDRQRRRTQRERELLFLARIEMGFAIQQAQNPKDRRVLEALKQMWPEAVNQILKEEGL